MYSFKVGRLVVFIVVFAYFPGAFWYILTNHTTDNETEFTFYNYYKLEEKTD